MKHLIYFFAFYVLIFSIIGNANAQIPNKISYQGLLTTSAGTPVPDGSYDLTFKIFNIPAGGSALWTENQTGIAVQRGTFNVLLGSVTPLNISFNQALYVEVTAVSGPGISSPITFSPRSELASSPYSLSSWNLTGNSGTTSGTNFVGTTDAQAFDVRTNNVLRTRITTKGQIETYNTGQSVFVGEGAGASDDLSDNANVFIGYQAGLSNTGGFGNTANGVQALYSNTTGNYNTANGAGALFFNTTGAYNTANGSFALYSNTTGNDNTANGYAALYYNTTGGWNTANGYLALYSNTTGWYNAANGYLALFSNTTGGGNTANGLGALLSNTTGSYNTANGYVALYSNTTGWYNTANGAWALSSNTTGYSNTANGYDALSWNTTGFNNTALGFSTGSSVTTGSNLTLIGYDAEPTSASATNQITLGNSDVTSLRCAVTTITALSDARDKKNIQELSLGLDFISKIKPRQFNWDKREWYESNISDGSKMQGAPTAGFIAQELDEVQTTHNTEWLNLVLKDNPEKLEATPGNLLPIMVKAIQELKTENEDLKKRLSELEAMVKSLVEQRRDGEKKSLGELR